VAALKQLKDEGIEIKPGQSVSYIITDSRTKDYKKRVVLPEFVDNNTKYDANKYYQYLLKGAESILLPFGYTEERLDEIINGKMQKKLYEYA
jgi:DNA polymerase elongation subunit (family B)